MKKLGKRLLILHGWGGSDYPHWQSWLACEIAKDYGTVCFPLLDNPHFPSKNRQMRQIKEILNSYKPDIVICHSLACTLWFHLCQEDEMDIVEHLLLVSPPANSCDIDIIKKFFPVTAPKNLHAKESFLVTSSNDPYMTTQEAKTLKKDLDIEMLTLENAEHINTNSGYGEWAWVLNWTKERIK
jgi:predicted alpha/beta hydrolase family esterase